jgi:hypothetical protein
MLLSEFKQMSLSVTSPMDLKLAIAYEFFLDHIDTVIQANDEGLDDSQEQAKNIHLLARCALQLGDIFEYELQHHENIYDEIIDKN